MKHVTNTFWGAMAVVLAAVFTGSAAHFLIEVVSSAGWEGVFNAAAGLICLVVALLLFYMIGDSIDKVSEQEKEQRRKEDDES